MSQSVPLEAYLIGAQITFNSDAFDSEDNRAKWSTEEREAYNLVRETVIKQLISRMEIFYAKASSRDISDLEAVIKFLSMSQNEKQEFLTRLLRIRSTNDQAAVDFFRSELSLDPSSDNGADEVLLDSVPDLTN